jgi:hypothetical protein
VILLKSKPVILNETHLIAHVLTVEVDEVLPFPFFGLCHNRFTDNVRIAMKVDNLPMVGYNLRRGVVRFDYFPVLNFRAFK